MNNGFGVVFDVSGNIALDAEGEDLVRRLAADALVARHLEEYREAVKDLREKFLKMALEIGMEPKPNPMASRPGTPSA